MINPAVRPHALMKKHLGENANYYTSERWVLDETHILQLSQIDVDPVTHLERYMLMLQTADETLDYRDAAQKYSGALSFIEQGGSHSFDDFERYISRILEFCRLN